MNKVSETRLVTLVAIVQFIFVIDFMMVAPLGPDYTQSLGAENSDIGFVVASYTLAAAISSLLLARFLDRFDRKKVMMFFLISLSFSTVLCAFAQNISELTLYRFIAGFFGGPAASMAMAMIIDVVPAQRRGKAIGKVMSAFSLSSIIGIPIGLELSQRGGWEMPFYVVGTLILLTAVLVYFALPAMTSHLVNGLENNIHHDSGNKPTAQNQETHKFRTLFYRPEALVTYFMTMTGMLAAFFIIPNIATYMQFNLSYPRESYGVLYFWGGLVSLVLMVATGRGVDKYDIRIIATFATVLIIAVVYAGFVAEALLLPATVLFIAYMAAMTMRNVISVSMSSMVPLPHERAAFTSLNQSVSHFSAGAGAILSSIFLSVSPSGDLIGMDTLGLWAIGLSLTMPICLYYLSWFIKARKL